MKVSRTPKPDKLAPAHSSSPKVGSLGYDEMGGVVIRSSVVLKWCPKRSTYAHSEVLAEEA